MSTTTTPINYRNGHNSGPPRWIWEGIVLVALCGMGAWMWNRANDDIDRTGKDVKEVQQVNVNQGNTLINHEVRITSNETSIQKMDAKLDRILEHVSK